jgi:hypothetical protein
VEHLCIKSQFETASPRLILINPHHQVTRHISTTQPSPCSKMPSDSTTGNQAAQDAQSDAQSKIDEFLEDKDERYKELFKSVEHIVLRSMLSQDRQEQTDGADAMKQVSLQHANGKSEKSQAYTCKNPDYSPPGSMRSGRSSPGLPYIEGGLNRQFQRSPSPSLRSGANSPPNCETPQVSPGASRCASPAPESPRPK